VEGILAVVGTVVTGVDGGLGVDVTGIVSVAVTVDGVLAVVGTVVTRVDGVDGGIGVDVTGTDGVAVTVDDIVLGTVMVVLGVVEGLGIVVGITKINSGNLIAYNRQL
jgi:hypothetical protein